MLASNRCDDSSRLEKADAEKSCGVETYLGAHGSFTAVILLARERHESRNQGLQGDSIHLMGNADTPICGTHRDMHEAWPDSFRAR